MDDTTLMLARASGYAAGALLLLALSLPLGHYALRGRRAELKAAPVTWHVRAGMIAAAAGFLHPLVALLALGSPGAVGGGDLGLAFGGLAFMVLLAHTGLGLSLRDPKLKRRPKARRAHLVTASVVVLAVAAHAALCLVGAS